MEYIIFDFYSDTKEIWLERFCNYFKLNLEGTKKYLDALEDSFIGEEGIIKDLNINLNEPESSTVKIMCKHMTT
ncbi:TPA: hypothetical protein ACY4R5_001720 [Clostridium perfringens]|uniref:hypothetical protein n=1 Tax=Clostridium perfringens TaxID=1502 RepID=UPI003B009AC3